MKRSRSLVRLAVLAASACIVTSCAAAEAELARMEATPQIITIDAAGEASVAYDPSATVPTGADTTVPDLFEQPLDADPASSTTSTVDPDPEPSDDAATAATAEPAPPSAPTGVPVVQPTIVERHPHDGASFTQGLAFADGVLIESLGLFGESARRRVEPTTGEVAASVRLTADQFGAGLDVVGDRIIQLTWEQGVAIVADVTTLIELARFTYEGEGWGVCGLEDGRLAMSNGSGFLTFRDGATFEPVGELEVTLDGAPVTNLNELECVGSNLYANVWLETDILEIDAASGEVTKVIDASALVPGDLAPDDVLNGVAYRPETDTFFVTGKRWTVMYEVTFD